MNRRTVLKTAAVGVGATALSVGPVAGSAREGSGRTSPHTLTIAANGPVEYAFTVDGELTPDTDGGDFSADEDDAVFDPEGPANVAVRDETGPLPEDAGGTKYLGDRLIVTGYVQSLSLDPDPGYDANVYLDEELVGPREPNEEGMVPRRDRSLMITANGPTTYEVWVEGNLRPDTDGGDFSADEDDGTTRNGDGTVTASDETGPLPEDAGGLHFLGDRYLFSGTVEEFDLRYDASAHDAYVYLDEENVSPCVVRDNAF